ncbi:aminotransferase class I/II-fold pyridoxal phosphate-dependent enzyme [Flavobacteriaceae bacterium F08102]|nr:aminotransferase class I/II-fold pyridoxal phosphate-dependent enzyme [Flavobacteriaceae bacterium F08102]
MKSKILLAPPDLSGDELSYIQQAIATNNIASYGENIDIFERQLKTYLNVSEVVAVNSGTSAIHLALIALGVERGDEILCQSFTFSATANPIIYLGATPIFIDSERETWNMCPVLLEEAIVDRIKNGKKPKAIIAVHLYGMPYKTKEINALSVRYNIPVIEDAAEALGSRVNDQPCGSFGHYAIISFNGNKIITTGAGGAIVCNSLAEKERFIHLATQAKDNAPHYQHSSIGYNYRMSNLLAGIGRAQMNHIDKHISIKRKIFSSYKSQVDGNFCFLEEPEGSFSNRWLTTLSCTSFEIREQVRISLTKNNIEAKPLWKPLHLQPVFQQYRSFINGTSEEIFSKGLCLPSGVGMTENDLNTVTSILSKAPKNLIYKK